MPLRFKGLDVPVRPMWEGFLTPSVPAELARIESQIGDDFTPPAHRVLRCLDMAAVRCVILGQDPYPQPGVATGRAFEVAGAESWADRAVNSSLKNILKALYRTYRQLDRPPAIAEVRTDRGFAILPPGALFDHWERQGVLLLNTALTCHTGDPGSHAGVWPAFTNALIAHIRMTCPDAAWLLWGGHARAYRPQVDGARVYEASHPSSRDNSFVMTDGFRATADLVEWYGI